MTSQHNYKMQHNNKSIPGEGLLGGSNQPATLGPHFFMPHLHATAIEFSRTAKHAQAKNLGVDSNFTPPKEGAQNPKFCNTFNFHAKL